MSQSEADKLRSVWMRDLSKRYGDKFIMPADEKEPVEYRSSGSLALDVALGGGWGKGGIVQLTGPEGGGKTLLFDMAAVEAQREGKRALIFDFEGTYDVERFKALGGDPTMLDYIGHENIDPMLFADTAFDIAKSILTKSDEYGVLCFDSTGAMITIAEYEKKMEKGQEAQSPFLTAKAISDGLKILVGMIRHNPARPTVFMVSQGRDNIGAMGFKGGPPPDKQTGGRALRYYASAVVQVRKGDRMKIDDELGGEAEVGSVTRVTVKKNKCNGNQGRVAEFDVYYAGEVRGLDRISELAKLAVYAKVITRAGAWYTFETQRWQGLEAVKDALQDDTLFNQVTALTKAALAAILEVDNENQESENE